MTSNSLLNPKNWFLKGKDKARFNARRKFYGENLDRALADIDYAEGSDALKMAHLDIDKKYNRKTEMEYDKEKATINNEPYVTVIKVHMDGNKPSDGFFELDWNDKFIEQLVQSGYVADSQEMIVKLWFDEVCANVARENGAVFPQEIEEFKYKSARKVKSESGKTEVM